MDIRQNLLTFLDDRQMSVHRLSRLSGINYPSLFRFVRADRLNLSGANTVKLLNFMEETMAEKPVPGEGLDKGSLIEAVASDCGRKKTDVRAVLDSLFAVMTHELKNGGAVSLLGVGKLVAEKKPARVMRHPKTGEEKRISERIVIKLRTSPTFKKELTLDKEEF